MSLEELREKRSRSGVVYYERADGEIISKCCTKCHELKSLSCYMKKKDGFGGRRPLCNTCEQERARLYREKNRDKESERKRKYREENPNYHRDYYKNWIIENSQRKRDYDNKYNEENREQRAESTRKWYQVNRDHKSEYNQLWHEKNHTHHLNLMRNWRKNNPEKVILKGVLRRAQISSLLDNFTPEQMSDTLKHFGNGCALTGESADIHWDHLIPIASGKGGTTKGNMIPLKSVLNLSKNDSNIFEWFYKNKERFDLDETKFNKMIEYIAEQNNMTVLEYKSYYDSCFTEAVYNKP